jgi:hypothetical protein
LPLGCGNNHNLIAKGTLLTYIECMQVIVEMPEFIRKAKESGISDAERAEIVSFIAANPKAGDEIKGTGGTRKVRIAVKGKGKSGGARVITFYSGADIPVFLLTMYVKGKKESITDAEKNTIKTVCGLIVDEYRRRN